MVTILDQLEVGLQPLVQLAAACCSAFQGTQQVAGHVNQLADLALMSLLLSFHRYDLLGL